MRIRFPNVLAPSRVHPGHNFWRQWSAHACSLKILVARYISLGVMKVLNERIVRGCHAKEAVTKTNDKMVHAHDESS